MNQRERDQEQEDKFYVEGFRYVCFAAVLITLIICVSLVAVYKP